MAQDKQQRRRSQPPLLDRVLSPSGEQRDQEWMTTVELAAKLNVRVDHVRSLVARKAIPYAKVGRLIRFHWPSVERRIYDDAGCGGLTGSE